MNVLVYAHKTGTAQHEQYRDWLLAELDGPAPVAVSELVLSGVVRVVTHPRVFDTAVHPARGSQLRGLATRPPRPVVVGPGPRNWRVFAELVTDAEARGNLVPDAYHAALAIEHGCEWITTDRDYARFTGLRWRHPLDAR